MKRIKVLLLCAVLCLQAFLGTGCWNYREVNDFLVVAGAAVDRGANGKFILTAELVKISGGKDSKTTPKLLSAEGDTLFDAARNLISYSGKRIYWSHAEVIILSQQIAIEGVDKIVDWYCRDAETREDVYILISKETSAKDIFNAQTITADVESYELSRSILNQVSLSKAPDTSILKYNMDSEAPGGTAVIPTVYLRKEEEPVISQVEGCAIIKDHRLIGYLDGKETQYLLFIRNEVEGGIIVQEMRADVDPTILSLEIFNSKSKTSVEMNGDTAKVKIETKIEAALGENAGGTKYDSEEGQKEVEEAAKKDLEDNLEKLIQKVQNQYGVDIFRFGQTFYQSDVKSFRKVEERWDEVFKSLSVEAKVDVHLKNSGLIFERED